jgi:hypothetical protein
MMHFRLQLLRAARPTGSSLFYSQYQSIIFVPIKNTPRFAYFSLSEKRPSTLSVSVVLGGCVRGGDGGILTLVLATYL